MARGTTLSELRMKVRAEARLSANTSRGIDANDPIDQAINRVYETFWDDYDWPFLRVHREDAGKPLYAGQRYYDFPEDLAPETVSEVWAKFGDIWHKLEYGIRPYIYNELNSDENERSDPPLRWEVRDDRQFEIWPLPASDGELRFVGKRAWRELVNPTDRAEIDDQLIYLTVAGEQLAANEQKDAQLKFDMAAARLRKLRARTATGTRLSFAERGADRGRVGGIRLRAVYNDRNPE